MPTTRFICLSIYIFNFLLSQSPYFIYLICLGYPSMIGLIKLVPALLNDKMKLRYEWQIQFLSLFFAGLPYRGLYLTFNEYQFGLAIILIKFFYKLLIYYLQFRFAQQVFDIKRKLKNSSSKKAISKDDQILIPNELKKKQTIELAVKIKLENQQKTDDISLQVALLKDRGSSYYQMIYKLEIIQFSDILHLIGVMTALLLTMWVNTNNSHETPSQKDLKKGLIRILVLFFTELSMEIIYTISVTKLIGKTKEFFGYSFHQFISDLNNFSEKQFYFIVSSILCSYSILFIVLNN